MDSSKGQRNETEKLAGDVTWSHMTWSQKYSDFYVESKDGLVFKCHKYVLDQNCPYFEALLSYDYKETKESWLKFRDFDGATVGAFLQYLYSHKYDKCAGQQFNRKFSRDKLTSGMVKKNFHHQLCLQNEGGLNWIRGSYRVGQEGDPHA